MRLNDCKFIGNLVADPQLKQTKSGVERCTFTMAVNSYRRDKDPLFLRVASFRNSAQFVGNNLSKGSPVLVQGELQIKSYQNEEGSQKWWTEVVANNVQSLAKKSEPISLEHIT